MGSCKKGFKGGKMLKKNSDVPACHVLFLSGAIYSQAKVKLASMGTTNPIPAADQVQDQKLVSQSSSSKGISFTFGGGYFKPMGDMDGILKPSWNVVVTARNNYLSGTLFGADFDVSYATLKDKDFGSGRVDLYGSSTCNCRVKYI
jgi:hypothetical protein